MTSNTQRGFTLVELMVSMAVGGILLSFVLSSGTRMSAALRAEHRASELNTTLNVVRGHLVRHARNVGHALNVGFKYWDGATVAVKTSPLEVVNGDDAPDMLRLYYAAPDGGVRVDSLQAESAVVAGDENTDAVEALAGVELAVLTNPVTPVNPTDPVMYAACVVSVTEVDVTGPMVVRFEPAGVMNAPNNPQCADVIAEAGLDAETMLRPLLARSYRVVDVRLQMSPSGELIADDWTDVAVGVVNLQLASRWWDGVTDPANPISMWVAGSGQTPAVGTASNHPQAVPVGAVATELSVSVEVRTLAEVAAVPSARSGNFSGNEVGDWAAMALPAAAPYAGNHLFRSATTRVELRNLVAGRRP